MSYKVSLGLLWIQWKQTYISKWYVKCEIFIYTVLSYGLIPEMTMERKYYKKEIQWADNYFGQTMSSWFEAGHREMLQYFE